MRFNTANSFLIFSGTFKEEEPKEDGSSEKFVRANSNPSKNFCQSFSIELGLDVYWLYKSSIAAVCPLLK
jgi:hypothetical protein